MKGNPVPFLMPAWPPPGLATLPGGLKAALLFIWLLVALPSSPALGGVAAPQAGAPATPAGHTARLGILAFRPKPETEARWRPLLDYLQASLPDVRFTLTIYHMDELERSVGRGEVDFILTQPSHYVLLTYRNGLSSPLASLVNREGRFGTSVFGGVIVVRAERDDIASLADLRGKTLATPALDSLGAYQMQAYELRRAGVELPDDARLLEVGHPQDKAIEAVLSGRADAGFARTGVVEAMMAQGRLDARQFKLLGAQWQPGFPFLVSTRLYPEWPFAAMPQVQPDLARRVTAALLSLPHDGDLAHRMKIVGFTIPGDYRGIDELLRELRLPPFERAPAFTFDDVVERFRGRLAMAGLLVFLVLALGLFTLLLLNRRLRLERNRVASNEARQRALFQALGEGVLGCDLDARCVFINPKALAMLGYREDECLGREIYPLLHAGMPHPSAGGPGETLQSALLTHGSLSGEETLHRRDGSPLPVAFVATPLLQGERLVGSVLAFSDISARKAAEARIHHLAYHDELTGLPNRGQLLERLAQALTDAAPGGHALLLLNIDRFKVINNARGGDTGDALLIAVGRRLAEHVTPVDCLARLAADEFALLLDTRRSSDFTTAPRKAGQHPGQLPGESAADRLETWGDKLHAVLERPFHINGESFRIRASLGIAVFPVTDTETPDAVLLRAESALRRAKEAGGGHTVLFETDLAASAAQDFRLERELRQAAGRGELRLFLQPQVDTQGDLAGAEVLLRWQHPELGLLPPGRFIPIAEESDLIVELGGWVLAEASHILANAGLSGLPLRLAVNISPRHFRQSGFVPWLRDLLAASGADPRRLTLEITEGLVIDNLDDVVAKMRELAQLGIRLSIDDFGTGYSSLAYLRHLPLHELKIDRDFVSDADHDTDAAALVETILAIADHMNLEVVAEGIETPAQAAFLQYHGPMLLQGYHYGRPEAAEIWLERWRRSPRAADWHAPKP